MEVWVWDKRFLIISPAISGTHPPEPLAMNNDS